MTLSLDTPARGGTDTDERTTSRLRLVRALRLFAVLGYSEGIAGHISVRDPILQDHYWVNEFGTDFSAVDVDDLMLLGPGGDVVEGSGRLNPSVHPLHGELHRARPGLESFVHSHSMYGKTWSSLGRLLDPLTQDACAIYGRQAIYRSFRGLISDEEEGREIAAVMGDAQVIILQNHGFLTGGGSVEEAAWWFVVMERCAQSQLMAEAAGTPVPIDHDVAVATGATLASPEYAELQFANLHRSLLTNPPRPPAGDRRPLSR